MCPCPSIGNLCVNELFRRVPKVLNDNTSTAHSSGADSTEESRYEATSRELESARLRLSKVQGKIRALLQEVKVLTKEKKEIISEISNMMTVLRPIRKVPLEILQRIFLQCIFIVPLEERNSLDLTWAPWAITHVCSAWRKAAISYPALWSHIAIRMGATTKGQLDGYLATQLSRTSNHLLYISLTSDKEARISGAISSLRPTSSRWEELTVVGDSWILPVLFNWSSLDLPSLRFLTLTLSDPALDFEVGNPAMASGGIPWFASCPRLEAVEMTLSNRDFFVSVPWSQLTKVALFIPLHEPLAFEQSRTIMHALKQSHGLKDLFISEVSLLSEWGCVRIGLGDWGRVALRHAETDQTYIEIPCEKLHLGKEYQIQKLQVLLERLRFPSLRHLELPTMESSDDVQFVVQILKDSKCSLESLSLYNISCPDGELWWLFDNLSKLLKSLRFLTLPLIFRFNGGVPKPEQAGVQMLRMVLETDYFPALEELVIKSNLVSQTTPFRLRVEEHRPNVKVTVTAFRRRKMLELDG
jgi:hypothetical protein